jgi:hypothetical protein
MSIKFDRVLLCKLQTCMTTVHHHCSKAIQGVIQKFLERPQEETTANSTECIYCMEGDYNLHCHLLLISKSQCVSLQSYASEV